MCAILRYVTCLMCFFVFSSLSDAGETVKSEKQVNKVNLSTDSIRQKELSLTHRQKVDAKIQDFLGGMGLTQDWM